MAWPGGPSFWGVLLQASNDIVKYRRDVEALLHPLLMSRTRFLSSNQISSAPSSVITHPFRKTRDRIQFRRLIRTSAPVRRFRLKFDALNCDNCIIFPSKLKRDGPWETRSVDRTEFERSQCQVPPHGHGWNSNERKIKTPTAISLKYRWEDLSLLFFVLTLSQTSRGTNNFILILT